MGVERGNYCCKKPRTSCRTKSVIGLTAPKMEVVRVGFVGLGMRGPGAVSRFTHIPGTQIVALCDYDPKRAEACQNILKKASMPKAAIYSGETGYEELCKRDDIDLVYIAADWLHHFPIAKCALENGKHVAIEVPSAMNLQECWDLVNLSETTRKHCFILENCCYDWFEMNTLNMAQNGVFGEVIRAQGAYIHNLSDFWDYYWKTVKTINWAGVWNSICVIVVMCMLHTALALWHKFGYSPWRPYEDTDCHGYQISSRKRIGRSQNRFRMH